MPKCLNCGEELVWDGSETLSEMNGVEYDDNDEQTVNTYFCPKCKVEIRVIYPSNNMLSGEEIVNYKQ